MTNYSLTRRYWMSLVGLTSSVVLDGYSLWSRYWATLLGSPPRPGAADSTQTNGATASLVIPDVPGIAQGDSKIANGSHLITVSDRRVRRTDAWQPPLLLELIFRHMPRITRGWPSLFRDDGCFHANIDPERRPSCVSVAFCRRPVKS